MLRNPLDETVAVGGRMGREQFANWQVYDDVGRRKYLNQAERRRFLAAADRLPRSERALCHLLAFTGCRITEALCLSRDHLDADRGAVLVRTLKRRKVAYRSIPIPPELIRLLQLLAPPTGSIWPMHRATAWRLIKRVMDGAEIAGPMACPRGLRHGYGILAASSRVPGNLIQRWMGHISGTTTAIYLDAVGQEEREFAERMW